MAIAGQPDDAAILGSDLRLADLQGEWRDGIKRIRAAAVARSARDIPLEEARHRPCRPSRTAPGTAAPGAASPARGHRDRRC